MKLDPNRLVDLSVSVANKYVREKDTNTANTRVVVVNPNNARLEEVLTYGEWVNRIIQAACIMYAESGGDTEARCYNVDDANGRPTCSPTPPAGPRGVDRGLWQWNNVAWPTISDLAAFDPEVSTDMAYRVSNGFATWGPWTGSRGLDANSEPSKTVRNSERARSLRTYEGDTATEEIPFTPIDVPKIDLFGWADALGRLLSNLISAAWWRRVGVGFAGVALVIAAVVWLNRGNIATVAGAVA